MWRANKVGRLILLQEKAHSKIYKEVINNQIYCLKIYSSWESCSLTTMLQSYLRYFHLENKEGLVKIHNVWMKEDDLYIRMEFLKDYLPLTEWVKKKHSSEQHQYIICKIFKILTDLLTQGYLNPDLGSGTFMVNKNLDVKMIDLDILSDTTMDSLPYLGNCVIDLLKSCSCQIKEVKNEG